MMLNPRYRSPGTESLGGAMLIPVPDSEVRLISIPGPGANFGNPKDTRIIKLLV
jgi:hypothetical protein